MTRTGVPLEDFFTREMPGCRETASIFCKTGAWVSTNGSFSPHLSTSFTVSRLLKKRKSRRKKLGTE